MNDKIIDDFLDSAIPEADLHAKKMAINMAVTQFSQKVNQGSLASDHPIDNDGLLPSINSNWSNLMNFLKNPNSGRVFASIAIGFVALSVAYQLPRGNIEDSQPNSAVDVFDSQRVDTTQAATINELKRDVEYEPLDHALEEVIPMTTLANKTSAHEPKPQRHTKKAPSLRKHLAQYSTMPQSAQVSDFFATPAPQRPDLNENYVAHEENRLTLVTDNPVSTFSADVDTASYSLLRSQLQRGFLPAPEAVRSEEIINYFNYHYPYPESKSAPFKASISVVNSPWNNAKKLVHIGIKGYDITPDKTPDSNLVFLLDVSGSMSDANKLPLVKQSISLLLSKLKPNDTVSIVVYAGAAGVVLEPTKARDKTKILAALQRLNAGGSTAGGAGIELAYQLAEQNFKKDAVNRIILATDGDFNVGQKSNESLKTLVKRKRESGVFLSILGFGRNNYQDDMMQTLSQNGNGVAAYIDSLSEAKKVLVDEATATLFTIAKDVKFQVEFNPQTVSDYRLIGYETRKLNREDFNNDKVDAGDIGSGHTVTAIYEITPTHVHGGSFEPLRYGDSPPPSPSLKANTSEYAFLKMRYKLPDQTVSALIEQPISIKQSKEALNSDVAFSIAVASFAQHLKGATHLSDMSLHRIAEMARASKGEDHYGYRSEFIQLVELAEIAKP